MQSSTSPFPLSLKEKRHSLSQAGGSGERDGNQPSHEEGKQAAAFANAGMRSNNGHVGLGSSLDNVEV